MLLGSNLNKRHFNFVISLLVLIAFHVIAINSRYNVSFVVSESIVPVVIIWEELSDYRFINGDYIVFEWEHEGDALGVKKGDLLTKRVFCMPKQNLVFRNNQFFCDLKPSHLVQSKSRKNKPLSPFKWNGDVPEGSFFVEGDNPLSYDSKYFGFIDLKNIKGIVRFYL